MEKKQATNDPIDSKHKVQQSNDEHIDQDFENYPHGQSNERLINPKNKEDRITSDNEDTKAEKGSEADNSGKNKMVKPHDEGESGHTGTTGKNIASTDFPGNEGDKNNEVDESLSDGSGGAFSNTETLEDDEPMERIDEK